MTLLPIRICFEEAPVRRPVFDSVVVASSFDRARHRFGHDPASWLPAPATVEDDGVVVTMRASGVLEVAGVDAVVTIGDIEDDPPGLAVRPIAWRARIADSLFPRMVAELELAATSPTASRLGLVGSYSLPLSVIGDLTDRVAGRHVSDAVVRTFLEEVAHALAVPATSPAPPH